MRYGIFINQVMCVEWGITGRQSNAAHVFAILHEAHAWAEEVIISGQVFYWTSRQAICDEIAYLDLKPDTVYRHLKLLHEKGLISYVKEGKKDCIRITEEGKKWNKKQSRNSDSNPKKLGFKSEKTRIQIRNSEANPKKLGFKSENNSDLNPTYQSTNIDQNTNDQKTTHNACAREENSDFKNSKKNEEPLPAENSKIVTDPFPPRLMKFLEGPTAPDFFWDAFDALITTAELRDLTIDFTTPGNADTNIKKAVRLFNLLKLHRKIPDDGSGLSDAVRHLILSLPGWFVERFELSLIVTKFDRIINEINAKRNRHGKVERNYAEAAQRQKKGEKITF